MKQSVFYTLIVSTAIVIASLVGGIIFLSRPTQMQNSSSHVADEPAMASQTTSTHPGIHISINDIVLKEFEKSKNIEVVIKAQQCSFVQPSDTLECATVTCTLLQEKNTQATLTAPQAHLNRTEKTLHLAGGITGTLRELTFITDHLCYHFGEHMVHIESSAHYQHPFFSITATKSFVDVKKNQLSFSGGVCSTFFIDTATRTS